MLPIWCVCPAVEEPELHPTQRQSSGRALRLSGLRARDLYRVSGLDLGFRVQSLGSREFIEGLGFRFLVEGSGFSV